MFQSSTIYLTIISIVVIVVLIIAAVRTSNKLLALAYVMIATGAIGNVIDRFTQTLMVVTVMSPTSFASTHGLLLILPIRL